MTGMYPSAISVTGNGNPVFPEYYEDRLISHVLANNGYDCGLIGKLHLASAFDGQENRVNDGYRYFQYSHDHGKPTGLWTRIRRLAATTRRRPWKIIAATSRQPKTQEKDRTIP